MKFATFKKTTALLLGIILIASLLRLWQLGQVPGSIDWDEAANGYNAYSIMLTGRDEYGTLLPVVMRSFGDYKPALYSYLTIPFIPFFDLSALSVRLPSAIAGIIGVLIAFFIVKELTKRSDLALVSSFLLAISPWHIQFSRVGFEANVGLTLNLLGVLFFLRGLKKPLMLCLSTMFFALSLYAYQSEKVFVPLLLVILAGVFYKQLLQLPKKYLIYSAVVLLIISLPIVLFTFTNKDALARAKGVSILSSQSGILHNDVNRLQQEKQNKDILGVIFDNRRVVYIKAVLDGYLSHYDLNWLFFKGDATGRHHAPSMGLLYVIELPFLLLGIYLLLFGRVIPIDRKSKLFVFLWFLATPIPASITTGVPHAVRTINFLPTFQIFIALGIMSTYIFFQKQHIKNSTYRAIINKYPNILVGVYALFLVFFATNVIYYLDQYFIQQNYLTAKDWQYGYKQLVDVVKPIQHDYHKIIVSDGGDFDQSYIFLLFYLKYDPHEYLSKGGSNATGENGGHIFSNFEFRKISYNQKMSPLLLVGEPQDFPNTEERLDTIYYPDGEQAMVIVKK